MHDFSAGIIGTGKYIPGKVITNHDLEKMVDTSDEWIIKRTGIKKRHILEDGIPSYKMGIKAAELAISDAGINPEDIDLIITTTAAPDYLSPSMACLIQKGINAKNAAAFDLNAACTGFVYAMVVAQKFIESGYYRYVLIVSNEGLSRVVDWKSRNTCVLFGDAAGAVVLGKVDRQFGIKESYLASFGDLGHNLTIPCCYISDEEKNKRSENMERTIWQDGSEVFTFAVRSMTDATRIILDKAGISVKDMDYLIPHQANLRIINGAAKRLEISDEQIGVILHETGNISSASIPVVLDIFSKNGKFKNGNTLIFVAFGGGLTCGSLRFLWGK
jgi:3-oxoacyl-[acyl-carrier-protein] synthase-3